MAFFRDLTPCTYFPVNSPRLLAVGWLDNWRYYRRGAISAVHRERLATLLVDCWAPWHLMGFHDCELCGQDTGVNNLFVPGDGVVYASPEMIEHYIGTHGYKPPSEFLESLVRCPDMGSTEYFSALVDAGGKEFAEDSGLVVTVTPCPFCGKPLITPRAQQCRFCKTDWHDPDNPKPMRSI